MGVVSINNKAYAKLLFHAAKYPHCAVTGVLLADASKLKEGSKAVQDLEIVDARPLFHHSHYVSPMAEVALMQIESIAVANNQVIAGFYAACENYLDNTIEKCPGQKIAEKIAETFPSAVFIVIDNKNICLKLESAAINMYKWADGKWKPKDENDIMFQSPEVLNIITNLFAVDAQNMLTDFDAHLDDVSCDWSNAYVDLLLAVTDEKDKDD